MSSAANSVGTILRRWNTTTAAWVAIAEILSISNTKTKAQINVTSLDSTDGYEEFIGGFRDGGSFDFELNFTRAGYDLLNSDFESDTNANYEMTMSDPDYTSLEVAGTVVELGLAITVGAQIKANAVIKISGKPTTNSGSGS